MGGMWAFDHFHLSDDVLTQAIGVIVLFMIVMQVLRKRGGDDVAAAARWKAACFGVATGFATYIANAAGPIMSLYLLSMALPKNEFMGTGAWFFFIINLVKIPQFAMQGRINAETLWIDLCLAPAVIIGALIGRWLFSRIPQALFERIIIVLALVATVTLFLPHGKPTPPPTSPLPETRHEPAKSFKDK